MTTVRELSERLGVSKTAILRYVKEEMHLQTSPRKTLQLSANQCAVVADHFSVSEKGKQISTENQTENHLQTSFQFGSDEVFSLQIENAALKAENEGLRREVDVLRERLSVADAALEREQMQARGFWSRLGQKLLGDGKP